MGCVRLPTAKSQIRRPGRRIEVETRSKCVGLTLVSNSDGSKRQPWQPGSVLSCMYIICTPADSVHRSPGVLGTNYASRLEDFSWLETRWAQTT